MAVSMTSVWLGAVGWKFIHWQQKNVFRELCQADIRLAGGHPIKVKLFLEEYMRAAEAVARDLMGNDCGEMWLIEPSLTRLCDALAESQVQLVDQGQLARLATWDESALLFLPTGPEIGVVDFSYGFNYRD